MTIWKWASGISKHVLENKNKTRKTQGKYTLRFTRELYWPFHKGNTWTVIEKTCSNHVSSVQVFGKHRTAVIKLRAVHECTKQRTTVIKLLALHECMKQRTTVVKLWAVQEFMKQNRFGKQTQCIIYRFFFPKSKNICCIILHKDGRFLEKRVPEQILK